MQNKIKIQPNKINFNNKYGILEFDLKSMIFEFKKMFLIVGLICIFWKWFHPFQ